MSRQQTISVIMPCFNHGEFLAEAVASVTNAKRDEIELIVVDDGSTDERTIREVNRLRSEGVKVIRQENKGLAGARNAAISASQGKYIFPLDADDRMRSGWIDRAVSILDSEPEVGVVYGDAQFFGIRTDVWPPGKLDPTRLLHYNYIPGSALYRRTLWKENRGYDCTMPVQGYEDWDMWVGALERGWEFVYLPEVFFEYRKAEQSMLTRGLKFKRQVKKFMARKHPRLYRFWTVRYLYWTVRNLYRAVRFQVKHPIAQLLRRSKYTARFLAK